MIIILSFRYCLHIHLSEIKKYMKIYTLIHTETRLETTISYLEV